TTPRWTLGNGGLADCACCTCAWPASVLKASDRARPAPARRNARILKLPSRSMAFRRCQRHHCLLIRAIARPGSCFRLLIQFMRALPLAAALRAAALHVPQKDGIDRLDVDADVGKAPFH